MGIFVLRGLLKSILACLYALDFIAAGDLNLRSDAFGDIHLQGEVFTRALPGYADLAAG